MAGEEAIGEPGLIANEKPEAQTEQPGRCHESTIQPRKSGAGERKRQGECRGDQHHACDRAGAKNQQIEDCPFRIVNGAQHQESNGGGTCQAVNDSNEQGPQGVIKAQTLKRSAKPSRGRKAIAVMFGGRRVRVPMKMDAGAVFV